MASNSSSSQWANLQYDLLLKIAKCVHSRLDVLRLRAVCHSWRCSIPLPPKTPSPYPHLKLPFPIAPDPALPTVLSGYFLLTEATIYALQPLAQISDSCTTWIIKIFESNSGKVIYKYPFSPLISDGLNPFEKSIMENIPKSMNLLDYRVHEITKVHGLHFLDQGSAPHHLHEYVMNYPWICKVVASSNLDKIGDEFVVMALHNNSRLAVWRCRHNKWSNIEDQSFYADIAYHNGKFYAVDIAGLIISVDPFSLQVTKLIPAINGSSWGFGFGVKYLVTSFGNLFSVDLYDVDCVQLIVHKLDEERREWVKVEGLDDRALFIGFDVSFSVMAKSFHGCKRNCVYYTGSFAEGNGRHLGYNVGFFDVENGNGGPLSKFPDYSNIFWPPPIWLRSNAPMVPH